MSSVRSKVIAIISKNESMLASDIAKKLNINIGTIQVALSTCVSDRSITKTKIKKTLLSTIYVYKDNQSYMSLLKLLHRCFYLANHNLKSE